MGIRILIVEDDEVCRLPMEAQLTNAGHEVTGVDRAEEALHLIDGDEVDVLITDVRLPGKSGLELIAELQRRGSSARVIVVTGYGTIAQAVEAMKLGACDYLTKPVSAEEILLKLQRVIELDRLRRDHQRLQREVERRFCVAGMVGVSATMRRVLGMAEVAKDIDTTVLIAGETGVGKEALAKVVHYTGARKSQPFVAVNCQALSRDILESELFGHEQVPSPGRSGASGGVLSWPRTARCFWTTWTTSRWSCRSSSSACWTSGGSSGSAGRPGWSCMPNPTSPPNATSWRWFRPGPSARTSTIASR